MFKLGYSSKNLLYISITYLCFISHNIEIRIEEKNKTKQNKKRYVIDYNQNYCKKLLFYNHNYLFNLPINHEFFWLLLFVVVKLIEVGYEYKDMIIMKNKVK